MQVRPANADEIDHLARLWYDGWHETHVVRDEYDVLLEDGALCRIYRQGEQWFLRGAYD